MCIVILCMYEPHINFKWANRQSFSSDSWGRLTTLLMFPETGLFRALNFYSPNHQMKRLVVMFYTQIQRMKPDRHVPHSGVSPVSWEKHLPVQPVYQQAWKWQGSAPWWTFTTLKGINKVKHYICLCHSLRNNDGEDSSSRHLHRPMRA